MLIMPQTSKNFQALADRVAHDFFTHGTSIADGVTKIAMAQDMTPEEVRRLVEKSNTASSILFLKNAPDKKAAFKLASVDEVLKRTHPTEDDETDISGDYYDTDEDGKYLEVNEYPRASSFESDDEDDEVTSGEIPQTRKEEQEKHASLFSFNKTAAKNRYGVSHERDTTASDVARLHNFIEKRKQEKLAARNVMDDTIQQLVNDFSKAHSGDFSKLATEAIDAYGNGIRIILQTVADNLGAHIQYKTASLYINDNTEHMQLLKTAARAVNEYREASEDISVCEQTIKRVTDYWQRHSL